MNKKQFRRAIEMISMFTYIGIVPVITLAISKCKEHKIIGNNTGDALISVLFISAFASIWLGITFAITKNIMTAAIAGSAILGATVAFQVGDFFYHKSKSEDDALENSLIDTGFLICVGTGVIPTLLFGAIQVGTLLVADKCCSRQSA